jgi:2-polyprenyl-3-methyl-5-hydroxy-6-metoxy-1,4-benzoquinol methylase
MTEQVFTEIFKKNIWNSEESVSGTGSELRNTKSLRFSLSFLLKHLDVKSLLDVACGDMTWVSALDLNAIEYEGWDIVDDIIQQNKQKFAHKANYNFKHQNILEGEIPKFDLIMSRDTITHLPTSAIWIFLKKVVNSNSKYLLISRYEFSEDSHSDINFGQFRAVNLEKPPFNFNNALLYIKEDEPNKFLALYLVDDIRKFFTESQ